MMLGGDPSYEQEDVMLSKRMITTTIGLGLLAMTTGACATLGGAAIGAGTGKGAGKGALIGTGIGAAAGTIYGAVKK